MLDEVAHGGALDRMKALFPDAPAPWIDLSTGINPWPFRAAGLSDTIHDHLPEQTAYENCRRALALAIDAPYDCIRLAPGSELLIHLLAQWLPCKRVVMFRPSYEGQHSAWRRKSGTVIESENPLKHVDDADAVVLCNPNNPDGRQFSPEVLCMAQTRLASRSGWLIVDEAYADLTPDLSLAPKGGSEGLIVLRSFGKFYGLAGLRLGGIIAPTWLCEQISDRLGAWPISSAALEIGTQAYLDLNWQQDTRRILAQARRRLDALLVSSGIEIAGGTDLFRLLYLDDALVLWKRLAEAGISVRRFQHSPHHLRVGLPADDTQLARLQAVISP